jgi:hypothetical protein
METYNDKNIKDIKWTKYKIIVPSEDDRQELMDAFEHIHYSDVDSNFVAVDQLIHEYLDEDSSPEYHNNIIVDEELFNKIKNK